MLWPIIFSTASRRGFVFRATSAHKGEFRSVRGPLNIARPIQGWPVIRQAGASNAGRQLAAEMIFASGGKLAGAQRYCADVRERAQKAGRDPGHIKLPAASSSATPRGRRTQKRAL